MLAARDMQTWACGLARAGGQAVVQMDPQIGHLWAPSLGVQILYSMETLHVAD